MCQSTCAPEAASILINLEGYQVVSVGRATSGRRVLIEPPAARPRT